MIYLLTIVVAWFFTGWLGYRLIIPWWTQDLPMTRKDRRFFRWCITVGPANLVCGLWCYLEMRFGRCAYAPDSDNDIIYPRKGLS